MTSPDISEPTPEPFPTQQEVVKKLAGFYADRLLYTRLWRDGDINDGQFRRWRKIEDDLLSFTLQAIPRIESQELPGIKLAPSPIDSEFYIVLPGERIKIATKRESVEKLIPNLAELVPPLPPVNQAGTLPFQK